MGIGSFGTARLMRSVPGALDAVEARRDRATDRERLQELRGREDIDYAQGLEDRRRRLRRERTQEERGDVQWEQGQEDRGTRLEREETQWEQGQEDRATKLRRGSKQEARQDKAYKIAEEARQRYMDGNEAIRAWMVDGNISAVEQFANTHDKSGRQYSMNALADGNYQITITDPKGEEKKVIKTEDEIGKYIKLMSMADPQAEMKAKEVAGAEQAGKVQLERVKGEQARQTERVKQSGTGGALTKQQNALADDAGNMIAKGMGFESRDAMIFDKPNTMSIFSVASALSEHDIRAGGATNGRQAGQEAIAKVKQWHQEATKQGEAAGLKGAELEAWVDSALYSIAKQATGQEIKKQAATPAKQGGVSTKKSPEQVQKEAGFGTPSLIREAKAEAPKKDAKPYKQPESEKKEIKAKSKALDREKERKPLRKYEQDAKDKRTWARKIIAKYKSKHPKRKHERQELKKAKEILKAE